MRDFAITPTDPQGVVMFSEVEPGVYVVEAMRFLWPQQAREMARSKAYRAGRE